MPNATGGTCIAEARREAVGDDNPPDATAYNEEAASDAGLFGPDNVGDAVDCVAQSVIANSAGHAMSRSLLSGGGDGTA